MEHTSTMYIVLRGRTLLIIAGTCKKYSLLQNLLRLGASIFRRLARPRMVGRDGLRAVYGVLRMFFERWHSFGLGLRVLFSMLLIYM